MTNFLLIAAIIVATCPPVGRADVLICGEVSTPLYLPILYEDAMPVQAIERIEQLLQRQNNNTLDARITEIFEEAVTVRMVGSDEIRTNVTIPAHVNRDTLSLGQAVRLGEHQGQPILLAVLDKFGDDTNYSGLGGTVLLPPGVSVYATRDGWLAQWANVPGALQYHVYINDIQSGVSPTDVGIIDGTELLIAYDGDPPTDKYVGVVAVRGSAESDASAWVTDSQAPPAPNTFQALNDLNGHELTIGGNDNSLGDISFKCWEIQVADDDSGTGAASLGYFYPADLPHVRSLGDGTIKYYRIRSIDWAGNTSDWTSWDAATAGQSEVKDFFDGYGGPDGSPIDSLWWLEYDPMDDASEWTGGAGCTVSNGLTNVLSGGSYVSISEGIVGYANATRSLTIDLSQEGRFTDNDYFVIHTRGQSGYGWYLRLRDSTLDYYQATWTTTTSDVWEEHIIKKSDFSAVGTPDWSDIQSAFIQGGDGSGSAIARFDDLRMVKADPDDSDTYNNTGGDWERAANTGTDTGWWHIYAGNRDGEPQQAYSFGQIKTAASPSVWYLAHKPLTTTDISHGTVQAGVYIKENDGKAGLAFFVSDVSAGSWDMYVVEADSSANTIALARYVAGARTQIASTSFTIDTDEVLWLGVDFKDFDSDSGRLKVYASTIEGNLIQAANLIISEQDTNLTSGGSVGLLSYQANTRFVSFVAGSPAHAETADVARSTENIVLIGTSDRARFNKDSFQPEKSTDGADWTPVTARILIVDKKSANTNGGGNTAGSGWETRDLTDILIDETGEVTLSSNDFDLPAGTYDISKISSPGYRVDRHKIELYDVDNTATQSGTYSTPGFANSSNLVQDRVEVIGRFTITETTTFRIRHNTDTTQASNGFGVYGGQGSDEIYTIVDLDKIA